MAEDIIDTAINTGGGRVVPGYHLDLEQLRDSFETIDACGWMPSACHPPKVRTSMLKGFSLAAVSRFRCWPSPPIMRSEV